jgi:hypothetical protein
LVLVFLGSSSGTSLLLGLGGVEVVDLQRDGLRVFDMVLAGLSWTDIVIPRLIISYDMECIFIEFLFFMDGLTDAIL